MEPLSRNCFFRVSSWSDSTDYEAWVRGIHADRGELWKLSFKTPEFSVENINGKEIPTRLILDEQDRPVRLETGEGALEVHYAQRLESPGVQAERSSPSLLSPAPLPSAVFSPAKAILEAGEVIRWWALPGKRSKIISVSILGGILAGISYFAFHWLRMAGLCTSATPADWKVPCFVLFGLGTLFLGIGVFSFARLIRHSVLYKPVYVVTDRRAIILSRQGKVAEYAPWEVAYAEIRRRGEAGDVLFPTQTLGLGNFWSIRELAKLEEALSQLLR